MNFGHLVIAGIVETHKNKLKSILYGNILIDTKGIELDIYGEFYFTEGKLDKSNLRKMHSQRKTAAGEEAKEVFQEVHEDVDPGGDRPAGIKGCVGRDL